MTSPISSNCAASRVLGAASRRCAAHPRHPIWISSIRASISEERTSSFQFDPPPRLLEDHRAHYKISLQAGERCSLFVTVGCNRRDIGKRRSFFSFAGEAHRGIRASKIREVSIQTSNEYLQSDFCALWPPISTC